MKAIILLTFLIQSSSCLGQIEKDILSYNKAGTKYFQNNERIKQKKLKSILLSIPESKYYFKKYKTEGIIAASSLSMSFLFAFLATQQPSNIVYRKNNEVKLFMYGVTSILFNANFLYFFLHRNNQLKKSIQAYNKTKRTVLF
jgi:hypothetical protein